MRLSIFDFRFSIFVACLALAGCNAGMEPTGPTPDQIRAKIDAMPPEKQIDLIEHSPMSRPEKDKRLAEIRQKFNLPAPAAQAAPTLPPGVPAQAGGAGL